MKRLIALILIIVTLLSTFVSCGLKHFSFDDIKDSDSGAHDDNTLTIGQWLGMVNNAFGMEDYVQESPYVLEIDKSNKYFNTIQIAAEWGVIDVSKKIDPEGVLLTRDALITLVNVGDFLDKDDSDSNKIKYAIENFGSNIKNDSVDEVIDIATANTLLINAKEKWATRTYEPKAEVEFLDNVKELSNVSIDDYELMDDGVIVMNEEKARGLVPGDIFTLPRAGECSTVGVFKVKEVVELEDGIKLVTDNNLELQDFVEELYVQETVVPDLTMAQIRDGNGNLIQESSDDIGSLKKNSDGSSVSSLAYTEEVENNITKASNLNSTALKFKVSGYVVELCVLSDGIQAKIKEDKDNYIYGEITVSNLQITQSVDYSWGVLHSAEVRADYKTKHTIGYTQNFEKKEEVCAPKYSNGNGHARSNWLRSVWKNKSEGGAKTIKLCSITVASVAVGSINVDFYAKFEVDGSVEIVCVESGGKGIEYKDGRCRVINTSSKDKDINFKANVSGVVGIRPNVKLFNISVIAIYGEFGFGTDLTATIHLADEYNHLIGEFEILDFSPEYANSVNVTGLSADAEEINEIAASQGCVFKVEGVDAIALHMDTCIDVKVYFVLKVGLEKESLAGKLLKNAKATLEWEILGSKNATIINLHVDNLHIWEALKNLGTWAPKSNCIFEYTPFDKIDESESDIQESESEETQIDDEEVGVGEVLVISDMKIILGLKETAIINVSKLPSGYTVQDLTAVSVNPNVATVSANGTVSAISEGSTTIIVKTKDGKYMCACAVTVMGEQASFTPLD